MGKTVLTVVGVVAAVAIAIAAPMLGAALAGALAVTSAAGIAMITAGVTIALSLGVGLAMKALTAGAPSANIGPPQVFRQSVSDSFIVYGKRRVGGLLVFFHPRKSGKKHYRYFVIACAGHRCKGVTKWFLGDEQVTVDGSGKVTSGKYANAAWLWFQRGLADQTAHPTFVSECGGKWTSAHKGIGIAAIYAKFEMTDASVEAGMPNVTAEIEGKDDLLDPRDGIEKYSRTAALVYYDWACTPRPEGGFGLYPEEVPEDSYISAIANVCDEIVDGEERYALDAMIVTGAPPSEIRDVMVVNCAGVRTYSGGKELMRPGYWVPVSETITEDDFAGAIQVSPFNTGDRSATEVQGTYINPEDGYQGAPAPTQALSPEPDDVRQLSVDLGMVTSPRRAARILNIMLRRAQAEKSVVVPLNISGLKAKALDTVQLATSRYGLSNYAWQVVGWRLSADWGVVQSLREENADIYGDDPVSLPAAPPALAVAAPVLTSGERQMLINGRRTVPTHVLSASETGGSATVTMIEHQVIYPDGHSLVIEEQVFAGLDPDTPYYLHYVDIEREDTLPIVTVSVDSGASTGLVGVHDLGRITSPETGSGIVYEGGGSLPPGQTIGREVEA